jgi:hypothetical protein
VRFCRGLVIAHKITGIVGFVIAAAEFQVPQEGLFCVLGARKVRGSVCNG